MVTLSTNLQLQGPDDSDNAEVAVHTYMTGNNTKLDGHTHGGGLLGAGLVTQSNVMGSDVLLNNTATTFDGPNVAQGTAGTWFVSGQVTLVVVAGDAITVRLWDGTTVVASQVFTVPTGTTVVVVALSGIAVTPAGNLRISVRNNSSTTGKIAFNQSGLSKDGCITAVRIG